MYRAKTPPNTIVNNKAAHARSSVLTVMAFQSIGAWAASLRSFQYRSREH